MPTPMKRAVRHMELRPCLSNDSGTPRGQQPNSASVAQQHGSSRQPNPLTQLAPGQQRAPSTGKKTQIAPQIRPSGHRGGAGPGVERPARVASSRSSTCKAPTAWKVMFHEPVNVRREKNIHSERIGEWQQGSIVYGHREGEWLVLANDAGAMRIFAQNQPGVRMLEEQAREDKNVANFFRSHSAHGRWNTGRTFGHAARPNSSNSGAGAEQTPTGNSEPRRPASAYGTYSGQRRVPSCGRADGPPATPLQSLVEKSQSLPATPRGGNMPHIRGNDEGKQRLWALEPVLGARDRTGAVFDAAAAATSGREAPAYNERSGSAD